MNRFRKSFGVVVGVIVGVTVGVATVPASPRVVSAGPQIRQQVIVQLTKATKTPPAFPALTVLDVKSGRPFKLSSLAATKKATLVWFWAPH